MLRSVNPLNKENTPLATKSSKFSNLVTPQARTAKRDAARTKPLLEKTNLPQSTAKKFIANAQHTPVAAKQRFSAKKTAKKPSITVFRDAPSANVEPVPLEPVVEDLVDSDVELEYMPPSTYSLRNQV